jgi:dolichol-phosphate mannosyltransferase
MLQASQGLPYLSVVAPCKDEAAGLVEFYRRVTDAVAASAGGAPAFAYEIVLVNDGSRDATWEVMLALASADKRVIAVNLSRNHGHQLALTAGLSVCRGERVLIIDADLQDPPELLPSMLDRMDAGADVVYGMRRKRDGESRFKRWTASAFYRLLRRLADIDIPPDTGDFRLMSRRAVEVLIAMPEQCRFVRGMVSWIGLKQEPVLYDRAARFAGGSHYPLRRMARLAADAITSFSIAPLRIATFGGLAFSALAFAVLVLTGLGWSSPGWPAQRSLLAGIVLAGAGANLLALGMLGEYIGRLYLEAKRRPLFIIENVVGGHDDNAGGTAGLGARARPARAF